MGKEGLMSTGIKASSDDLIGTAGKKIIKAKNQVESFVNMTGATDPALLNLFCMLRMLSAVKFLYLVFMTLVVLCNSTKRTRSKKTTKYEYQW